MLRSKYISLWSKSTSQSMCHPSPYPLSLDFCTYARSLIERAPTSEHCCSSVCHWQAGHRLYAVVKVLVLSEKNNFVKDKGLWYTLYQRCLMQSDTTYLTTPEAAERSGLTKVYLAYLLRHGKLDGFRRGRDWYVYADSLELFLATPRKSGPKGPRKRSVPDELVENNEKPLINRSDVPI